jgi:plasmid stabilization system protein ParE
MTSGYKVFWTDRALNELAEVEAYIIEQWTEKELKRLFKHLELTIQLISENPQIFSESEKKKGVRRAVILKLNSLYYRINESQIEVLAFHANRKRPLDI